jgi:hypothetical protein
MEWGYWGSRYGDENELTDSLLPGDGKTLSGLIENWYAVSDFLKV